MRQFLLIFLTIFIITGCEEERDERTQKEMIAQMENEYLSQLARRDALSVYEETKFRLYCNYCNVKVKNCMGREMQGLTYGMLDMKVYYLKFDDGVGEMAFTFIYADSLQCTISEAPGNKVHGVGFSLDDNKVLYFLSAGETEKISLHCDTMADVSDCPTRMMNPDQPVIRKYLKKNRKKLDPWFHMQAVRRGFFDD